VTAAHRAHAPEAMHGVADGAGRSRALRLVSAASLAGRAPPARAWLVPEVIPAGATTLLSGDGGTGKSLLALMLAASVARGASWLGRPTERGPALVVSAEDGEGELHRRLAEIARAEGFDLRALSGLHLAALDGETILAARRSDGTLGATPLFAALEAAALPLRPRLIVLDTAAALFGGEEINRRDVQSFISMLNGLARSCGAAVLLLSHPSRAGLAAGDGLSGSTGWSNAVRARLYLEQDGDARKLSVGKSNYGPTGPVASLRWNAGAFAPAAAFEAAGASDLAKRKFLELLTAFTEEGRPVSAAPCRTFAPRVFAADGRAARVTSRGFEAAMRELLREGAIGLQDYGPPSRRRTRVVLGGAA